MKKFLLFMAVIIASAMVFVSCNKDDDEKDPVQVSKDLTSTVWEGEIVQYKFNDWGRNWERQESHWIAIRFIADGNKAQYGTGTQVEFNNESKSVRTDQSSFTWRIEGNDLRITYSNPDWSATRISLNDITINSKSFRGEMYDNQNSNYKFSFSCTPSSFNNFN